VPRSRNNLLILKKPFGAFSVPDFYITPSTFRIFIQSKGSAIAEVGDVESLLRLLATRSIGITSEYLIGSETGCRAIGDNLTPLP
jgi:hypothetical protein